jgi:hypothetical protein
VRRGHAVAVAPTTSALAPAATAAASAVPVFALLADATGSAAVEDDATGAAAEKAAPVKPAAAAGDIRSFFVVHVIATPPPSLTALTPAPAPARP